MAGDAGRIPVASLVHGLTLDDLDAGLRQFILRVYDHGVLRAAPHHAFGDVVDAFFIRLAQVGGHADHVHVVIRQPPGDGTTVQAARYRGADGPALQPAQVHEVETPETTG